MASASFRLHQRLQLSRRLFVDGAGVSLEAARTQDDRSTARWTLLTMSLCIVGLLSVADRALAQQLPVDVIRDTVPVPVISDQILARPGNVEHVVELPGNRGLSQTAEARSAGSAGWKKRPERIELPVLPMPTVRHVAPATAPILRAAHAQFPVVNQFPQVNPTDSGRPSLGVSEHAPPVLSDNALPFSSMPASTANRPAQDGIVSIPFRNGDTVISRRDLQLRMNNGLITLIASEASLKDILSILATDHGLNLVTSESIDVKVTVTLQDVPLADALNAILSIHGLNWTRRNNIISISQLSADQAGGAMVQGRMVRVYPLTYVRAVELQSVVQGLLSAVGTVQTLGTDVVDTRKSRDRLIVEDLPDYLDRVDSCVAQLDQPPQQVQILAHVLEVQLNAANRHGVNLEALSNFAGAEVSFKTPGFANPTSSPSMLFGLNGSSLDSLVDALLSTTDSRTLASPRIMVTHGQEAKIQIGGRIGFRQTTTTETSTVQGVEFLDVGVVLTVTPYIGDMGQILLKVRPEVSDGQLNLDTELPDERLTMVESTVLLNDGQGMVIGGLIREEDIDQRNKTPFLGQMWMISNLFQNVRQERSRTEVIVVIQSTIVPHPCPLDEAQQCDLERAGTPLFYGPLQREYRPWEPTLPDVVFRPQTLQNNMREFRESEGARVLPETTRHPSGIIYGNRFVTPAAPDSMNGAAIQPQAVPPTPMDAVDELLPENPYPVLPQTDAQPFDEQTSAAAPVSEMNAAAEFDATPRNGSRVQTSRPVLASPSGVQQTAMSDSAAGSPSRATPAQYQPTRPTGTFGISSDPRPRPRPRQQPHQRPRTTDAAAVQAPAPENSVDRNQDQKVAHNTTGTQFPASQRFDQSTQSRHPQRATADESPPKAGLQSWFRRMLPGRKEKSIPEQQ